MERARSTTTVNVSGSAVECYLFTLHLVTCHYLLMFLTVFLSEKETKTWVRVWALFLEHLTSALLDPLSDLNEAPTLGAGS